jgi:hypothetical protein
MCRPVEPVLKIYCVAAGEAELPAEICNLGRVREETGLQVDLDHNGSPRYDERTFIFLPKNEIPN